MKSLKNKKKNLTLTSFDYLSREILMSNNLHRLIKILHEGDIYEDSPYSRELNKQAKCHLQAKSRV